MKTITKILIGIVFFIGVVSIILFFTNDSSAKIRKAKQEIKRRNLIIRILEQDLKDEKFFSKKMIEEKLKAQRSFKKIKFEYIEFKKIKGPAKIKTIVIKEIEYVPKIEYIKLFGYSESFVKEYSEYINKDKSAEENTGNIIETLNKIIEMKNGIIDLKQVIINELEGNKIKVFSLFQYQKLQSEDHLSLEIFAIKKIYKNLSLRISYKLFYYLELESGFSFGLQFQIL